MSYLDRFYLTGSINKPSVEEAFAFEGSRLQPGVTRVPDGEPGDRANWVLTQTPYFLDNPTLDVVETEGGRRARLRPGTTAADVDFPAFAYQDHAIASYATFRAARDRGDLAPLANLAIEPGTEFYLGLLHADDGAAGARYRAALASEFLPEFGLSTECGPGRHSAEQLDQVTTAVAELFGTRTPALA